MIWLSGGEASARQCSISCDCIPDDLLHAYYSITMLSVGRPSHPIIQPKVAPLREIRARRGVDRLPPLPFPQAWVLMLVYLYGYALTQFLLFFVRDKLIVSFIGLHWGLLWGRYERIINDA